MTQRKSTEQNAPVTDASDVTDHQETILDVLATTNRGLRNLQTAVEETQTVVIFCFILTLCFILAKKVTP